MKDILPSFWRFIEERKNKDKTSKKVYNWMNKDRLAEIIKEENVYWIETTSTLFDIPNYVRNYIEKWAKKYHGVDYLFKDK